MNQLTTHLEDLSSFSFLSPFIKQGDFFPAIAYKGDLGRAELVDKLYR